MTKPNQLSHGLDAALIEAKGAYRKAVIHLAVAEAQKADEGVRVLADTDHVHRARTRVLALEAAREELARVIEEGAPLD